MASPPDDLTSVDVEQTAAAQMRPRPRRPLPGLVLALAAGLIFGLAVVDLSPVYALIAAFVFAVAAAGMRHPVSSFLLHGALLFTGMGWIQLEAGAPGPEHLRYHLQRARQSVNITGVVISEPRLEEVSPSGVRSWIFEARVEVLHTFPQPTPVQGRIRIRMSESGDVAALRYGDRWRWQGPLRIDERSAPRRQGLTGFMNANARYSQLIARDAGNPFIAWCYRQRAKAAETLGAGLPPDEPSVAFTRALLLGARDEVSRPVYETFARTGTLHILALSGMHVGILVFLLVIALKAAGIMRTHWVLFFIPFLATYTLATGAAASTVRASVMAIVFFASFLFRQRSDAPTSLAFAALLILLANPLQLFEPGFMLSFIVVGGLILLYEPVTGCLRRQAVAGDAGMEPEMSWFSAGAKSMVQRVIDLLGVSIAAWMVSLPLIAGMFHLVSPVALLVNIPLIPAAFVILLTACLSLITGMIALPLAGIFNHANWLFCEGLMRMVAFAAHMPWSHFYVKAWPWWLMTGWFVLLLAWVITRSKLRIMVGLALVMLVVVSITQRQFSRRVEAVIIPAGDAAVLLVDGPGDRAMMIDAGAAYRTPALLQLLRKRGIARLDEVWITRATTDATGGLAPLLAAIPVGAVYAPEVPSGQHHYAQRRAAWMEAWGETIKPWPAARHREAGELVVRVLYPPPGVPYRHARESAMMLHISHGVSSLLWMGQATVALEQRAMEIPRDWLADTLAVGFMENSSALHQGWLDQVGPRRIIFSGRAFDRIPQGIDPLVKRLQSSTAFETGLLDEREPLIVAL